MIVYDYGAKGKVVDTTVSIAATLAPVVERTLKSSGDIFLDFARGSVTGSMTVKGVSKQIDDTLPAPAFNSTDLELVVRSLTLRKELTTTVQIYDPEYGGQLLGIDIQADSTHYHILRTLP